MASTPIVVTDASPGWQRIDPAPPKLADATDARVVQWEAESDASSTLVRGCIEAPIPGWVEDMRPAIEGKTVALAGATAERVVGAPMDAREVGEIFVLKRASDLGGPAVGTARTFLGFDDGHVFSCIAVCASATAPMRACDPAVQTARLDGSTKPPSPGVALTAITWTVHHPRPTAVLAAAFLVAVAVLAMLTRRRPRFRAK